jgi:hypothetical protein
MSCKECRRTGRTPCKLNSTLLLTETYKLDKVSMGETEHGPGQEEDCEARRRDRS